MTIRVLGQEREIIASLAAGKENLLAVISPLRDVVRYADRHHASNARHPSSMPPSNSTVKIEVVPFPPPFSPLFGQRRGQSSRPHQFRIRLPVPRPAPE